jgi:hypothetical protein
MDDFIKVVNPGKIEITGRLREVFVEIVYKEGRLSLHGVVGPWHSGNCAGKSGQISDSLFDITQYTIGWDKKSIATLAILWSMWHLNDLNPGCIHQDEWDADKELVLENGEMKLAGHVYPKESPEGLLGKPCPVCGYKYGTAWLKREVPEKVLRILSGLPETKKKPAWV